VNRHDRGHVSRVRVMVLPQHGLEELQLGRVYPVGLCRRIDGGR
jgi:hypothetical protein